MERRYGQETASLLVLVLVFVLIFLFDPLLFEGLWVELFDWTGDAILKIGDESCEDGRGVAIKQLDHTEGRHLVAGPHVFVGFVVVEMFAEEGAGGNAEGFDADGAPLLLFLFLRPPPLEG